ncbi:conjugative transfer ATPase [Pseudoalteromonas sp. GutCa3]|uniref:conjugative transfer ATPase n=1 Tax=Pseudoalteromonas sp. GutCa3 TaxID=888433 RepID=UPI000C33B8B7|nr:conjugative transfer ATPase [Pseudoalteromonas sp. GutCa3]PKG68613.1 conjugative transfer ATPase [Pseudoalteromonas sp. GutCa3]
MVTNQKSKLNAFKKYGKEILNSFKIYDREPNEMVTDSDINDLYSVRKSFTDKLPWVEYLTDSECFLLDDERSVAAVYDIFPSNAEGVMLSELARIRDNFKSFLNEVFPQHDKNPWVVEFYQSDTLSLSFFNKTIRDYAKKVGGDSPIANTYLPIMEKHLKDVCKEGGLFHDDTVTGVNWRGAIRTYRMVFYRKLGNNGLSAKGRTPIEELNDVRQKVESSLTQSGMKCFRVDGLNFYEWLFRWFNPRPKITDGDTDTLLERLGYVENEDLPYGHDFSENLLHKPPVSDAEKGSWYFDDLPHKIVTVQNLRKMPKIGALSAPKESGKFVCSMFDKMPEGTVMSMKVTITPSDVIEKRIDHIEEKAVGESAKITRVIKEAKKAKERIANDNPMFPVELCFYIRGEDDDSLRKNQTDVISLLQMEGLNAIDDEDDPIILDSYIRNLPMNYDPSKETKRRRSRLFFTEHIANLAPILGRGKGSGNPGLLFFNRGGEPMCFDPLNPMDRSKNAHLCLFGPTGAGKSAQITNMLLFIQAIYNARIFLVEAGNSFGMLREYMKECGVSTHKVRMKSGENTTIPPFANALKALEREEREQELYGRSTTIVEKDIFEAVEDEIAEDDDDTEFEKDYLGEMEIITRIMVSGGIKEESKKIKLGDQQLIREAILDAARACKNSGRKQVITEDVANEILKISDDEKVPSEIRTRFFEYAAAMRKFTQGLAGQIFNREGDLWPECDFTHIDLAEFVKDNSEAELAVSYMSILNNVNDIAERDQQSGRPIIFLTDEAHLITKNPLLAPGVVKIVKMWRKLGAWLWLATQNMADFPNESHVMLSLFEWWLCLALEPAEVEEVARFKKLTDEQKFLLSSAKKQHKCYTEGVVLSGRYSEVFRIVPPSLALALAMSESDEKTQRKMLMDEFNITEVEAAKMVAKKLDLARGILT